MKKLVIWWASLLSILFLIACSNEQGVETEEGSSEGGVFLQILMQDDKEQEISYVLFNPNVKTLEACDLIPRDTIEDLVKRGPQEYSEATVTGWSCTFTNPEAGKIKVDRLDN